VTVPRPPRLVADLGGTRARFALCGAPGAPLAEVRTLDCAPFASPAHAARAYLAAAGHPPVQEACFAVAAPITGDHVRFTNLGWSFRLEELRSSLGLARLRVVNDFEAQALALPWLRPDELRAVGGGAAEPLAPRVVLGAGTGLGVAALVRAGERWVAVPGEGGHVALSPMDAEEAALLAHLWRRFDHVSAERLISGPGLQLLWLTLRALRGLPAVAAPEPEEITRRALAPAPEDPVSADTLARFCALLGTVAANLAVTFGARGGVYLGGGIVPALGGWFHGSPFRARFERKGRFGAYAAAIPTYVITAASPALRGAAAALDEALPG
jgi:glucokinase